MGIWRLAYVEKATLARYIRPVWLRVCIFNEVRNEVFKTSQG